MGPMRRARSGLAPLLVLATALAMPGGAEERERVPREESRARLEQGSILYRLHCRNCHGAEGRGDGPMADLLKVAPADLTRIAARHGGKFPRAELELIVDGRKDVRGHGEREMPVWGIAFRDRGSDSEPPEVVRARVAALVDWLESIQGGAPSTPSPSPARGR